MAEQHLIAPHGGALVNLLVDDARAAELRAQSADWPSWDLTPRQLCDLELLLSGGFSPLRGFLQRNRSGGLVHLALDVADLDAAIARVTAAGGQLLVGPVPDVAFDERRIAFVLLAGQVAELVERAP